MTSRALPAKISLVFSDVDGTLVTKDKRLTPAAGAAVNQLREAQIRFAIASSRPPFGLAALAEALDLGTPITAFNGGLTLARDGTLLSRHFLPREVAEKAIEWFANASVETWVFTPDQWLVTDVGATYVAFEQRTINS
ncbi:MAG TPA: HAD hydrolase family protein, partial [Beijerinckiaceae bacterium]|nr:HAD hydrolase family protein [Beijerinckiaceae bacterium]